MNFGRAFTYIFEDREWLPNLAIIFLLSAITFVPLVGLLALAALLGYMTELIYYVRTGHPQPLPGWQNVGKTLSRGGYALLAFLIYNLPNILVACCFFTFWGMAGFSSLGQIVNGVLAVVILCCTLPFLLVWNLIIYPVLGVGMIRYGEHEEVGAFFQLGPIFALMRQDLGQTLEWIVFMLIINVLTVIPVIGWVMGLVLWVPVQAHLLGQYAARLDAYTGEKPKPKRTI